MKLATWNVNSLRVRLPHLADWLRASPVDVLGVQEIKLTDDLFPHAELEALGYRAVSSGQKTYNGVALLARGEFRDVRRDLPGFADEQKRVIAATIDGVRVVNLYVPNGQAVGSDKYHYKLRWLAALKDYLAEELATHGAVAVMGDFNIAPGDLDVHDPAAWAGQVLCSEPERAAFQGLLELGFHDSFELFPAPAQRYTWWDYRAGGFARNLGLRIDHVLVSGELAPHCETHHIDTRPRALERPSDHAPVRLDLRA